ncbi:MAG: hypothetical protein H6832_15715 [Planctomycetes bacterium]|nr:hypothetical protein [Planctomycetota bacterium]MCB9919849.1 hypothetical protein [Planctomycetota bacterium]
MSESDTFSCTSCGKSYRRGSLAQGARVKCRACSAIIEVPPDEFEALEEVLETQEEASTDDTRAARRSSRSRSTDRSRPTSRQTTATAGRSGRPRGGQSERDKKAPLMLFMSLGACALIAGGLWFFSSGNRTDAGGNGGANSNATSDTNGNSTTTNDQTAKAAPKKTPRERYDESIRAAEASTDKDTKTAKLLEALELSERNELGDGVLSSDEIHEMILASDPDHEASRRALGFRRYVGDHPDYKDKWVKDDEYTRITTEWQAKLKEQEKQAAEQAELARWQTPFGKKAKIVADYYRQDVKDVPDLELRFYFSTDKIPNPYLLMVQDAKSPDPTATAELIGPGLAALRKQFQSAYGEDTLPSWDDSEFVVPVMILKDQKSYESYRDHGHKFFPSTGLAAAFYTPSADEGIQDHCRGTLYVWQGASESQFYHELFHEATHQIMHNAARLPRMPPTPWLEEGIAEFWGAYEGNQYSGYRFRRALVGRQGTISAAADAYFAWKTAKDAADAGADDAPDAETVDKLSKSFLTPKQFLGIDQIRFARAKQAIESEKASGEDQQIVSTVYALGWAWIFYSHVGPGRASFGEQGKFAKAFEQVLGLELRYRYNRDRLAEAYGITSDEEWAAITDDFFYFCKRPLRRYMSGDLDIPEPK